MKLAVTLVAALESNRELLANMMQLYLHDLSEFTKESISESGVFDYPYLDLYWQEPQRHPFLIFVGQEVAGFALVRVLPTGDIELAEFFILRRFRQLGAGAQAATQLFHRFDGTWRVAQASANQPAQIFWRTVVGAFTQGHYVEERSDHEPFGPCQIFSTPPDQQGD